MSNYLPSSIYREFSSRSSKYFIDLTNLCLFTEINVIYKIKIIMGKTLNSRKHELNQMSKKSLEKHPFVFCGALTIFVFKYLLGQ